MIGSATLGQGSVPLASETEGGGTPPPPPVIPLRWTLDLVTSFGHGLPDTDDNLPDNDGVAESFWLSPTIDADHATPDQVREWPLGVGDDTSFVQLIAQVDAADLAGDAAQLIVTINGVDTAIAVDIPEGVSTALQLSAEGTVYAPAGYRIGVRFAPVDGMTGGTLRVEARLRGSLPTELPAPAPNMWLWLKTTAGLPDGVGNTLFFEDQSGNGRDAQFAGAAVLVPNAIDGLPAIDLPAASKYDGVYMGSQFPIPEGWATNGPFYVAIVCIPKDEFGGPAIILPSWGANTIALLQVPWINRDGPPDVQYGLSYEKFLFPSQEFSDVVDYTDQPILVEFISEDGATLEIRVNGVVRPLVDNTIPPWGGDAQRYQISAYKDAPYALKCDMQFVEIIVRDVVTADAIAADRPYLKARFPSLGLPY